MPGHKRISGLSRRLPPLITLPRHGELSARRRHPSAAWGVPPAGSPAGCSGAGARGGWAAPGVPDVGASELGCPELAVLGAMGAPEMGCPEWGDRAAPDTGTDGPQRTYTLLHAHAPSHVHTRAHTCAHTCSGSARPAPVARGAEPGTAAEGRDMRGLVPVAPGAAACPGQAGSGCGGLGGGWGAEGPGLARGPGPPATPRGPEPQRDGGVGAEAGAGRATPGCAAPGCPQLRPSSRAGRRPCRLRAPGQRRALCPAPQETPMFLQKFRGLFLFSTVCPALG